MSADLSAMSCEEPVAYLLSKGISTEICDQLKGMYQRLKVMVC